MHEALKEAMQRMQTDDFWNKVKEDFAFKEKVKRYIYDNINNVMNKVLQFCIEHDSAIDNESMLYHPELYEGVCDSLELSYIIDYWIELAQKEGVEFDDDTEYNVDFYFNGVRMSVTRMYGQGCFEIIGIVKKDSV